jgi:hypothetical protein
LNEAVRSQTYCSYYSFSAGSTLGYSYFLPFHVMSMLYELYQYIIHGQEFDLSGLGVLEDQLRESHALVGGEVVASQEAEADLHPG